MNQSIGTRIRQFRLRNGLTQIELADEFKVHFRTLRRWELGEYKPPARVFELFKAIKDRYEK